MDIQAEKLNLIQWLADLTDEGIISKIKNIQREKTQASDWWDEISEEERNEIKEGIAQADRGELTPHKQVMEKYQKWL